MSPYRDYKEITISKYAYLHAFLLLGGMSNVTREIVYNKKSYGPPRDHMEQNIDKIAR